MYPLQMFRYSQYEIKEKPEEVKEKKVKSKNQIAQSQLMRHKFKMKIQTWNIQDTQSSLSGIDQTSSPSGYICQSCDPRKTSSDEQSWTLFISEYVKLKIRY